MLQELAGTAELRVSLAAISGPPKGPLALRVSATRHGVTGMNCSPWADPTVGKRAARLITDAARYTSRIDHLMKASALEYLAVRTQPSFAAMPRRLGILRKSGVPD